MGETTISHLQRPDEQPSESPNFIQVETITLDDFTETITGRVTGIKIDVEGFDFDVLKGSVNLLSRDSPLVLTEAPPSPELCEWVSAHEYSIYAFTREPLTRRLTFSRIVEATPTRKGYPSHTKMLFLVPERLERDFSSLAR